VPPIATYAANVGWSVQSTVEHWLQRRALAHRITVPRLLGFAREPRHWSGRPPLLDAQLSSWRRASSADSGTYFCRTQRLADQYQLTWRFDESGGLHQRLPVHQLPISVKGTLLKGGLQIVGRKGEDETVCAVAAHMEAMLASNA